MSLVKNIILYPATKLERYVMTDGEFNSKGLSLAQIVVVLSVVMLIADPILAMARYGNFVLQDAWFYVVSILCVGLIAMVARPGSEKSIKEMRDSSNILVKGLIYGLFGLIQAFEVVAKLVSHLFKSTTDLNTDLTENEQYDYVESMAEAYESMQEMDDYMHDVSNEAPTGTH